MKSVPRPAHAFFASANASPALDSDRINKINKIHSADSVNSVGDPYSNKTHKRIDALLVVITLVLMIVAFRASPQHRATSGEQTQAEQMPVWLGPHR